MLRIKYSHKRKNIPHHDISPIFCDDKFHRGDTVCCGMLSNILNIRLSNILLESIWTSVVERVVLLAKVVLAAASLHQHGMKQRQVLVLELTLGLILEPSLELGL
jgi:hypothetical protein